MNFSDKIKNKNEAMGKKSMASILKVNKYENPQAALDLVAHICTSDNHIDVEPYFSSYREKIKELHNEIIKGGYISFLNESFIDDLNDCADILESSLMNNSSKTINIAVAGGFSSGKSSLLNYLTKIGNKLPTGIEPVSVVNTYLTCNKSTKSITVKGVNLKNQLVLLNDEVLSCIQHSSKSKVYIASILHKLLLDLPSDDVLDGITFIDTPGYNNSLGKNVENDVTDKQTSLESFNNANVLFWCIDIEAGTISEKDFEMIGRFSGPVVIIFTKMDKKPDNEVVNIINSAANLVKGKFNQNHKLIDILAISTTNKHFISNSHYSNLSSIITKIKDSIKIIDDESFVLSCLRESFKINYDSLNSSIIEFNENKKQLIIDKEKAHKDYIKDKETWTNFASEIKEMLVDNYDEILDYANKLNDLISEYDDCLIDSLNREIDWNEKSGLFSDTSDLSSQHLDGVDILNSLHDKYKNINCSSYDHSDRSDAADMIQDDQQRYIDQKKERYDLYESSYKETLESIKKYTTLNQLLRQYENQLSLELSKDYKDALLFVNNQLNKLQSISNVVEYNIFDAISSDNLSNFLSCFSKGVDLTVCNKEGFSPLTWAVKSGNNEMVKFFLNYSNVIDLSQKDKRGFSALETAIIYHFQDICTLLIDKDKSLLNGCKSVKELSNMNNFTNWICQF